MNEKTVSKRSFLNIAYNYVVKLKAIDGKLSQNLDLSELYVMTLLWPSWMESLEYL